MKYSFLTLVSYYKINFFYSKSLFHTVSESRGHLKASLMDGRMDRQINKQTDKPLSTIRYT